MRWLVDACYLLFLLLVAPLVIYRSMTTGKYRRDWDQRFGRLPRLDPARRRVWIHAVSMGEVNSVSGLVAAWRSRDPEIDIVISATTDTGIDRARKLFPDLTVFRYPLDFSWVVMRAFRRINPMLIVLVELEVWYQFLTLSARHGIPVAVVNGRLTAERSVRRFRRIMPVARRMFGSLAWVGAQDEMYAERFRQLGVPAHRVSVTGSLKWDTAEICDAIASSEALASAMGIDPDRPLWVCGSTGGAFEEAVVLEAFARVRERLPDCQLAIIPRKPERFDAVAEAIRRAGYGCIRRSSSSDGTERAFDPAAVQLGDTMGELRKFYSLADVVFVGRTIEDMGGSDMMEVAALGRPMVLGPYTGNFADTMRLLQAAEAVRIVATGSDPADSSTVLAAAVIELLENRELARSMAERARQVVRENRGATERTLQNLQRLLERAAGVVTCPGNDSLVRGSHLAPDSPDCGERTS